MACVAEDGGLSEAFAETLGCHLGFGFFLVPAMGWGWGEAVDLFAFSFSQVVIVVVVVDEHSGMGGLFGHCLVGCVLAIPTTVVFLRSRSLRRRVQPQRPLKDLAERTDILPLPQLLHTLLATRQIAPVKERLDLSLARELPLLQHFRCELGSLLFDPTLNLKQLLSSPFLLLIKQMTHTENLVFQTLAPLASSSTSSHYLLHQPLSLLHSFPQLVHMSLVVKLQLLVKFEGRFQH